VSNFTAVSDSQVLLNSIFQNGKIIIDDENCPHLIYDLKYVEVDDSGDIKKDRSTEARKADLLDCCRYYLNTFHKNFLGGL
jgi:hypothetical protein